MDKELQKLFDDLNKAHVEMRAANDERFQALEKGKSVDPLLQAKLDRANTDISALTTRVTEMQEQLRAAENVLARQAPTGSPEAEQRDRVFASQFLNLTRKEEVAPERVNAAQLEEYRQYSAAFRSYLRRGDAVSPEMRAALSTGVSPEGGQFVTPAISQRVIELLRLTSPMRDMVTIEGIATDKMEGTYDHDEAESGWVGETTARPETGTPKVGKWTIDVHEQYANPKASQKQIDDTQFDIEGWLARKIVDRMSRRENTAFVAGNGVNQPWGFTKHNAGTPTATAFEVIRQINSGVNGGFQVPSTTVNPADTFLDIVTSIKAQFRTGALWAMNSLTLAKVRQLRDTDGKYLLIPDFSQGASGTLLGYGIRELEDMTTYSTTGALAIAFANWKEAYTILDHTVGMRTLRDNLTNKPWIHYYTTKRVGGRILNFDAITLMKMSA